MTEETPQEIFEAMNATKILVAVLETIKSVEVKTDTFLSATAEERELKVDYNEESNSFTFALKDKNEQ